MAVALSGFIEAHIQGHQESYWESFAEVEFNKDYPLIEAISEFPLGWPNDASIPTIQRESVGIDTGLRCLTLSELLTIIYRLPYPSPQLLGTIQFMMCFKCETRVLFYEM